MNQDNLSTFYRLTQHESIRYSPSPSRQVVRAAGAHFAAGVDWPRQDVGAGDVDLRRPVSSRLRRLALADAYQLPPNTVQYLHRLVGRAHNQLYRGRRFDFSRWGKVLVEDVPQQIFRDPCVHLAFALFWGMFLLSMALSLQQRRIRPRDCRRGAVGDDGVDARQHRGNVGPHRQPRHGRLLHSAQHEHRAAMLRRRPVRFARHRGDAVQRGILAQYSATWPGPR